MLEMTYFIEDMEMNKVPTLQDISIIYKDDNYIIVNKHYDVRINHEGPCEAVTVDTQLKHLYPELVDSQLVHGFRFVHQLDYSTSGALCLALNKKACSIASKLFMKRLVIKHYLAIVRGHVQGDVITIQAPIANNLDEGYQHMMCVPDEMSKNYDGIKPAKTEMQVVERGYYDDEPATKVLLTPHTGRRHQLRVHCSHIGHTIVGDYTYSLRKDTKPYRMMLHAYRLVIPIPDCHLDVVAPDTFLTEIDVKWKPTEKILSMTAIQ